MKKWNNVILAAGNYPEHEIPLRILQEAETVVCCDSAAERYLAEGNVPTAIVGDGDSLSAELKLQYAHIWQMDTEQDTNDLCKAMRFLTRQGIKQFAILGATGKREDHTLGNISLLIDFIQQGLDVQMFTNHGVFIPCQGQRSFQVEIGQQVSIISFGAQGFKAQGLKYPLHDFTNWWQGTLNEATETEVTIYAQGDYLVYMVYG